MKPAARRRGYRHQQVLWTKHRREFLSFKRGVSGLGEDRELGVGPGGLDRFHEAQIAVVKWRKDSNLLDGLTLQSLLHMRPKRLVVRVKQFDRKLIFQVGSVRQPGMLLLGARKEFLLQSRLEVRRIPGEASNGLKNLRNINSVGPLSLPDKSAAK